MSISLTNTTRISLGLLAASGALFTVWWIPAICMLLLSLRFRAWEVPLLGLLIDFLWLPAGSPFVNIPIFTLVALVVVWLFEPMRSQLLL